MTTNVRSDGERKLFIDVAQLSDTDLSGTIDVKVPFPASYLAVINQTQAMLYLANGRVSTRPADALPFEPGASLSVACYDEQRFTLFWSVSQAIGSGVDEVVLQFSNEPIPLSGSPVSSNVGQGVNVLSSVPVIAEGYDGAQAQKLKTDSQGVLQVSNTNANVSAALDETTAPLAINGVYTGKSVGTTSYSKLIGTVYADQAGTLVVEQSWDDVNWDSQHSTNVAAATPTDILADVVAPYARVKYTNGATAQTVFRLYIGGRRE